MIVSEVTYNNLVMNRPWSWICVPKKKGEGEG